MPSNISTISRRRRALADRGPHEAIEQRFHLGGSAQAGTVLDEAVEHLVDRALGERLLAGRFALGHGVLVVGNAAGMFHRDLAGSLRRDAHADG
jgi:hypothetical protein